MRTPRSAGVHAWPLPSVPAFTALACTAVLAASCTSPSPESETFARPSTPASEPGSRPEIEAFARSLKARFPAAFAEPDAPASPAVTLPHAANEPLRLHDAAAKLDLAIALDGARATEGAEAHGLVVYRGAAPSEGDLIHRRVAEGVEDLVLFERAPDRETLDYKIRFQPSDPDVSGKAVAAGLRLVGGVLEVLDRTGTPIFRARPPYVLDASGRHDASLSVEGCAVDTSPVAPFGRPVVAPGDAWCSVKVDWSAAHVRYPALVDPVWGTTFNTMATPRSRHQLTLLNPADKKSLALVTGGVATVGGAPLKSAEIYDPLSRRFSTTGNMNVARSAHTATLVAPIDPGSINGQPPVLIVGGKDGSNNPIGSLEVYDPVSGTFVNDSHTMTDPRFEHAAVLLQDNVVLIAGGTAPPLNQPTNTGYLYTFTAFGAGSPPASVTSTLDATPLMKSARSGLAMTRTTTGQALLSGGFVLAGGALQALSNAEIYNPATSAFEDLSIAGGGSTIMTVVRGYHTSTALGATGKILIAGGLSKTVGGIYTNTADLYDDGSQSGVKGFLTNTPITMATARANHSATLLPDGRVLVAGGFGGVPSPTALSSAEVFSLSNNAFTDLGVPVPMQPRGDHAALLVNAGGWSEAGHTVLVTGGANAPNNGSTATAAAQLVVRPLGDPCTISDECESGFCVDDVCCDTKCDQECYACRADLKQSNASDGLCEPALADTEPNVECINQVETHTVCDGNGSTMQVGPDPNDPNKPFTHSCKPAACAANGLCSTGCAATSDCDESGWCDLNQPSPEGDPGTCVQRKGPGAPCYGDDQCDPKFCVDGLCCNSDCVGQCQACNLIGLAGVCSPVGAENDPQDVHPNDNPNTGGVKPRSACAGFVDGVRTACTGACRGVQDACMYPSAPDILQDAACEDDPSGGPSTLTNFPCDGEGSYTEELEDCGGFRCADASTCKTSCGGKGIDALVADTECIADFVCTEGQCVALTGPLCDGKFTLRQPASQGGNVPCEGNYACPEGATACLTSCESILDCVQPEGSEPSDGKPEIVCAQTSPNKKECVHNPDAPASLPGCSVSLRDEEDPRVWWIITVGVGWWISRRRRA